jgi:hypothetical protein
VLIRLYGVVVTFVWAPGVSFVLLKLVALFVPFRVSHEHELEGLDISQHGEALQQPITLLNYLSAARRVSIIVSAACRALILIRHGHVLSAT